MTKRRYSKERISSRRRPLTSNRNLRVLNSNMIGMKMMMKKKRVKSIMKTIAVRVDIISKKITTRGAELTMMIITSKNQVEIIRTVPSTLETYLMVWMIALLKISFMDSER